MCMTVGWDSLGKSLLSFLIKAGMGITSLEFKTQLRLCLIHANQDEVGEWLRDQFRNGSMRDYKAKTNGTYMTYYLPFMAKVKRLFKIF